MKSLLTLALLSCCLAISAADKPAETKPHEHGAPATKPTEVTKDAPAKPYPLKTCIVSDNDLDSMGEQTSIVHEGRVLKFCCQPCVGKFQKNPAKYLAKLEGK